MPPRRSATVLLIGLLALILSTPIMRSSEPIFGSHLEIVSFTLASEGQKLFSPGERVQQALWRRYDYFWLSTVVRLEPDVFVFSLQPNERVFKLSHDLIKDHCDLFPSTHCY